MKAVALLLCGLGLALAAQAPAQADKAFLDKQIDVLDLLLSPHQPANTIRSKKYASAFNFDIQQQNSNNPTAVRRFQTAYHNGPLPRGQVFNYNNPNHLSQAIQLFDLFYFAKDYETFFHAASWAKNFINEGLFQYALSVAVLNRPDTQGISLFRQSETEPFAYVNGRAILQAQFYKQLGEKEYTVQSNQTGGFLNYIKQISTPGQNEFPFNNQNQFLYDSENQANQYQSQFEYNPEFLLSYYNEDINLNQQFAYEQLKNPAWFTKQKYQSKEPSKNQNNGENFYYYLQQALARYNLERYVWYLPNIYPLQFNRKIRLGYNPQLIYSNGQTPPFRPSFTDINYANPNLYKELIEIDQHISDAVRSKLAISADGSKIQLTPENGVQILGDIVQNNGDSPNNQYYAANNGYYGFLDQCRRVVASTVNPNNEYDNAPAAIENDHAANRDPAFYQCVSRVVNYFQNFKNQQKPYNQEQLNFPGVKVQSVNTDKLVTYYDNAEVDLFNSFYYTSGKFPEDYKNQLFAENFKFFAHQQQLNHKPFKYQIQVDSDKEATAVVRVFIGPKYGARGLQSLEQTRQNFVEIDRFTTNLKSGQNTIERSSEESTRFAPSNVATAKVFYKQVKDAQLGGTAYTYNPHVAQQEAKFPRNLILPKGSRYGQEFLLAVSVNPFQGDAKEEVSPHDQPHDKRPQGFPFDRVVRDAVFQQAQNIYFQTVKVFNKDLEGHGDNAAAPA